MLEYHQQAVDRLSPINHEWCTYYLNSGIVKFDIMKPEVDTGINAEGMAILSGDTNSSPFKNELQLRGIDTEQADFEQVSDVSEKCLTSSYEQMVNIFGRFKQETIALGLSELR